MSPHLKHFSNSATENHCTQMHHMWASILSQSSSSHSIEKKMALKGRIKGTLVGMIIPNRQ